MVKKLLTLDTCKWWIHLNDRYFMNDINTIEPTMNRDEGGYILSHVWDSLLATPSSEQ